MINTETITEPLTIESILTAARQCPRPATWHNYEFFKARLWRASQSCDEYDSAIRRLTTILGL